MSNLQSLLNDKTVKKTVTVSVTEDQIKELDSLCEGLELRRGDVLKAAVLDALEALRLRAKTPA